MDCSPHISIEPTIEQNSIIEVEEKPCSSSVSMDWWHGYIDHRVFPNSHPGCTDQKKLFSLTRWGTSKKLLLIEGK